MNTNQQAYYPNQPVPVGYYPSNGQEQAYANRYPNSYSQQMMMPQAYYQANHVHQIYDQPTMISNPGYVPTNNPRNPTAVPIIRPPNETPPGQPYNLYQSQQPMFPQPYTQYMTGQMHPAPTQLQYLSQPPTQSAQTSQPPLHNSQPSQPQPASEKRQRKPLAIVDPTSHEAINVPTSASSTNVTAAEDSTNSNPKSINDATKSKKQEDFRKDFARILNPKTPTDKDANQSSTKENQTDDHFQPSTSSSRSSSISKASSEQIHPVVVPETPAEDKSPPEPVLTEPESTDSISSPIDTSFVMIDEPSPPESIDEVTPTPADDAKSEPVILGNTPSATKRIGYTIEELRRKKESLLSQERPLKLIEIVGVTSPAPPPQPAKPEIDADEKFIRDVTATLNKLTPQNNDKLVEKLDKLELNSAKRLEAMISVMFVKAVEAAIFCSLYAKLCKHFQKKTVTVPDENGQPVTHYFRQLLLTRCQKEFECDYRQNIRYDEREKDVEAIVDQKARREAAEQLEEDLLKAKRKKLGNIIFIGELFKLQMLTDTIMYDCVEYLLRDKTDEEGLECLCKLLANIGRELDTKSMEKHNTTNRKNLEKNYIELENLVAQRHGSARIRFMIQDLMEMRKANWVARRAEMKPLTIDEIHETERLKREQQDMDRDRERQQRRDYNRMGGGPPQYTESRGSRGSGMRQQSNRTDDDRADNRVIASLKQYQSSEKRNPEGATLNFAPPRAWGKGSGVEKRPEDDRANAGRTNKPPVGGNTPYRTKTGAHPGNPGYPVQRQPSRELARDNNFRTRENPKEPLRKATSVTGPSNPSNVDSRDSSRNVSREQSRNVSPEPAKTSTAEANPNTPLDEGKIQARVHSLIEEYTGNYSDSNDRPVNEAIEDLSSFCTADVNQQAIIVQELFTNVLEAKPRARKAVGHLLDVALHKNTLSTEGLLSGIKIFIEVVPDYAVDIPLIWQYVAEILGAFIGAPSSNMVLLKPILQSIPEAKSKQLFQDVIQYAKEFSSEAQIRQFWQAAGFSLNDLLKVDSSFVDKYNWLNDPIEPENTVAAAATTADNQTPNADPQLVQLFKSINNQGTTVTTDQILAFIRENMDSTDKYYIRNIVLSYLEACLVNRDSQRKIQEDIAKQRMAVLKAIITEKVDAEVQAVYAIQNYVHKLEHPSKMARLLFDIFYDEECVSEEAFFEWLKNPDQSETQGHSIVVMSTLDFFTWLQQTDPDGEEEEDEEEEEN